MSVPPTSPAPPGAALRSLQTIWAAVVAALVLVGVVVTVVAPDRGSDLPDLLPVTLALVAGGAAIGAIVAVDRTFAATPPATDDAAAAQFRTRLFMQLAVTEVPLLLTVAMAFVLGPPWVAAVGAGTAVLGMLLVRPRPARVDRFDAAWRAAGTDVSLRRALFGQEGGR